MKRAENAHLDQSLRQGKVRDRALVLPLVGALLLISPLAGIFQLDVKVAGVPFTLIYLFVVWGLLIAGAARLAWQLREDDSPERSSESRDALENEHR